MLSSIVALSLIVSGLIGIIADTNPIQSTILLVGGAIIYELVDIKDLLKK